MFENLTNKLESIFSKLKSTPSLSEEQVDSGLKEIQLALLEADVALPVTKEFIANVKPKAIGKEIIKSTCLLYTSPSPRDVVPSRMPSSA